MSTVFLLTGYSYLYLVPVPTCTCKLVHVRMHGQYSVNLSSADYMHNTYVQVQNCVFRKSTSVYMYYKHHLSVAKI
jgi:hypothetical protein